LKEVTKNELLSVTAMIFRLIHEI